MKKSTKLLISLTSALLVAGNTLALTSCGGANDLVTGDVKAVAYDGSKTTVTFYHSMGSALTEILGDAIDSFQELYPNITVNQKYGGNYPALRDMITKEIYAGTAPSLAYCYPDHVAVYQDAKVVLPLDGYIDHASTVKLADGSSEQFGLTQAQKDDYVPFYYEEGKMYGDKDGDGKDEMYTLPMLKSTEVLFYNKTEFDKNGWEVPTTWDEMETLCEKIIQEKGKNNCIPLGYDSGANWLITMAEQMQSGYTTNQKGNYFTFDNENNHAIIDRFRGWYQKGYVTTEEIYGSYTSDLFTKTEGDGKRSYMCIGSSGGTTYQRGALLEDGKTYPFEVGVARLPQVAKEGETVTRADGTTFTYENKMISQGPSICLFKKADDQERAAAWLFAKYLTTTMEYQSRFSMKNGYTCVIQSVATQDPVYKDFLAQANGGSHLQALSVEKTLEFKNYYFVSPAFPGSSTARDEMEILLKDCFREKTKSGETSLQMIARLFETKQNSLKRKFDK